MRVFYLAIEEKRLTFLILFLIGGKCNRKFSKLKGKRNVQKPEMVTSLSKEKQFLLLSNFAPKRIARKISIIYLLLIQESVKILI